MASARGERFGGCHLPGGFVTSQGGLSPPGGGLLPLGGTFYLGGGIFWGGGSGGGPPPWLTPCFALQGQKGEPGDIKDVSAPGLGVGGLRWGTPKMGGPAVVGMIWGGGIPPPEPISPHPCVSPPFHRL